MCNSEERESELHIYTSDDVVKRFTEGYQKDRTFKALAACSLTEGIDERQYRAYQTGANSLLYFEDTDSRIRLCIPNSEHLEVLKELHDKAHESAHAGWE